MISATDNNHQQYMQMKRSLKHAMGWLNEVVRARWTCRLLLIAGVQVRFPVAVSSKQPIAFCLAR